MQEYSINYEERKHDIIECTNCDMFTFIKRSIENQSHKPKHCLNCPNYILCSSVAERIVKDKSMSISYNSSVRYEPNGIELIVYKNNHKIIIKDEVLNNVKKIDSSPLFRKSSDNKFVVCKDNFTYSNFYRSINESRKRTLQQFYNYGLANKWEYFITLTFSSEHVDRYDDMQVKKLWSKFEVWLKSNNPNAKILVAPEYHDKLNEEGKKALHFHGFISNVPNLTFVPAINFKTKQPIYSDFSYNGTKLPRLNLKDWKYGYSTADIIVDCNNLRICNYILKYMFKGESVGYKEKKYYHTRNLDMCYVDNLNIPVDDISNILNTYQLEEVKNTDNFTVYRTKREV